eukprot:15478067-Alexandrium_andersonii.AAC.1
MRVLLMVLAPARVLRMPTLLVVSAAAGSAAVAGAVAVAAAAAVTVRAAASLVAAAVVSAPAALRRVLLELRR